MTEATALEAHCIHRIKLDSGYPLAWDLGWVIALGLFPLGVGWRFSGRTQRPLRNGSVGTMLLLTAACIGAAGRALQPAPGQPFVAVVFRAGLGPEQVLRILASLDARLIGADRSMGAVVVEVPLARRWRLYR